LSSSRSAVVSPPLPRLASRADCATQFLIGLRCRLELACQLPATNSGAYADLVLPTVDSSDPNSPVSTKPVQRQRWGGPVSGKVSRAEIAEVVDATAPPTIVCRRGASVTLLGSRTRLPGAPFQAALCEAVIKGSKNGAGRCRGVHLNNTSCSAVKCKHAA
jgi:hypothetical protein